MKEKLNDDTNFFQNFKRIQRKLDIIHHMHHCLILTTNSFLFDFDRFSI